MREQRSRAEVLAQILALVRSIPEAMLSFFSVAPRNHQSPRTASTEDGVGHSHYLLPEGGLEPDTALAGACLDAVLNWREWCHRRVDSVHPLQGERYRIRHSMDCVIPDDPRLVWDGTAVTANSQLVVPVAFVAKKPMRQLDAALSDGTALPLVTMSQNVPLTAGMIEQALRKQEIPVSDELREVLKRIAGAGHDSDGTSPVETAAGLLDTGCVGANRYWDPAKLSAVTRGLIEDCARGFLLCVLVPQGRAGRREILKLSFHSQIAPADSGVKGFLDRFLAGSRMNGRTIDLQMMAPSDTRSYHLEFQTPPELECIELRIPDSDSPTAQDISGQPVAHVHASFDSPPVSPATVTLMVPKRGMWMYATLAAAATALIAWLETLLWWTLAVVATSLATSLLWPRPVTAPNRDNVGIVP